MASSFDRWEKDPFFSAAEEVQESADRMESTYRTWVHAMKDPSSTWNPEELRRDLHTALGTAKWQLEEFGQAVRSSYGKTSANDARDRHREFIIAIEDNISRIEKALQESALSEGKHSLPWVHLDEGERNELALFLSGSSASGDSYTLKSPDGDDEKSQEVGEESGPDCSNSSSISVKRGSSDNREEKSHGHRRTASAGADIGAWKIAIAEDGFHPNSVTSQASRLPRKLPSYSGMLNSLETVSKFKWPKNGNRKWKAMDCQQASDTAPLQSSVLTKGINACYEKSKSCLDSYDECYDKQLYGWYGALQRQLQRSQYQMQYSRPVRVALWVLFLLSLVVLIAMRAL